MPSALSRALGAFYGQCIGDALGSRYEFKTATQTRNMIAADRRAHGGLLPLMGEGVFGYGPGVVTDDGEMAMSLLASLVRSASSMDAADVACAYVRWSHTCPPDIGISTKNALTAEWEPEVEEALETRDWMTMLSPEQKRSVRSKVEGNVRTLNAQSLSNGFLMRQSVLAAYFSNDSDRARLLETAVADTLLTHCHDDALSASRTFACALHSLIRGEAPAAAYQRCLAETDSALVRKLLEAASQRPIPVALPNGSQTSGDTKSVGYFGVALQSLFYELLHCESFEEGLVAAVSRGGDTDTNGAIVAAALGARFGLDGIPEPWRKAVESAPLRLLHENGIQSFSYLVDGITARYQHP